MINKIVTKQSQFFYLLLSLLSLTGCQSEQGISDTAINEPNPQLNASGIRFSEDDGSVISLENRYRRKWDGAVVTDLDQDGMQDLIMLDHGSALNIYWNLGGKYSEPVTLFKKDVHGVSAVDYDKDGNVEIVIAQGGGDGKRPKFPLLFKVSKDRTISKLPSMDHFEFTRGRSISFIDADRDGSLELITTGFPLKSQPKGANYFYELDDNDQYQFVEALPQAKWLGYRIQTTDFNNDGDTDVLFFGGANVVAVAGSKGKSFKDDTKATLGDLADISHVSSITEIDFDNDGDDDLFLTRGEHQFKRQTFYDDATKKMAFFTFKKQKQFYDLNIKGDFHLQNLQMAYPDFDVYVGEAKSKLTFSQDSHGHKEIRLNAKQAKGWPADITQAVMSSEESIKAVKSAAIKHSNSKDNSSELSNKKYNKGIYIGHLGTIEDAELGTLQQWRIFIDSRARNAGVVSNVMTPIKSTDILALPPKLLENVDGKFVDVSRKLNSDFSGQTTSAAVADFNNDGWKDLFVVKYGNMATQNQQLLFINQQGVDFKLSQDHEVISKELGATGNGANVVDYDSDGDMDIVYANERGLWHLFKNDLSELKTQNNFVGVIVSKSDSGTDALDANVAIQACGTTQQFTVGNGGNSFSQSVNNQIHFGLGRCDTVDMITVTWRTGATKTVSNAKVNQYIAI